MSTVSNAVMRSKADCDTLCSEDDEPDAGVSLSASNRDDDDDSGDSDEDDMENLSH